jgi:hypothetical protein
VTGAARAWVCVWVDPSAETVRMHSQALHQGHLCGLSRCILVSSCQLVFGSAANPADACCSLQVLCDTCGTQDDDGERMIACDVCGIWMHTRCSG